MENKIFEEIADNARQNVKKSIKPKLKLKNIAVIGGIIFAVLILIFLFLKIDHIDIKLSDFELNIDKGNNDKISIKDDAYGVFDDTEIFMEGLEDGLTDLEKEKILNNHKYGLEGLEDGDLSDQRDNVSKFNYIWGIDNGYEILDEEIFNKDFDERLSFTHQQHINRIDWNYINQRSVPRIGNIICVPTSAVILLKSLGYDIDLRELIKFFQTEEMIVYARDAFPDWSELEEFIVEEKLYQITGIFTDGLNLFMYRNYKDFPYYLDYDYWTIEEISQYVEVYGLMASTFFPSYVLRDGEKSGGHMITITKVYKDFEDNITAFGINDPFGNPNVSYKGSRGWDGKNVIVSLDTMKKVMKSYWDDHNKGTKYKYRVLYFRDKKKKRE